MRLLDDTPKLLFLKAYSNFHIRRLSPTFHHSPANIFSAVCARAHTCCESAHSYGGQRQTSDGFLDHFPVYLVNRVFHWAWSSQIQQACRTLLSLPPHTPREGELQAHMLPCLTFHMNPGDQTQTLILAWQIPLWWNHLPSSLIQSWRQLTANWCKKTKTVLNTSSLETTKAPSSSFLWNSDHRALPKPPTSSLPQTSPPTHWSTSVCPGSSDWTWRDELASMSSCPFLPPVFEVSVWGTFDTF